MNDPRIDGAIEALTEQLESLLREVSDTKRMINRLAVKAGREPIYDDAEDTGAVLSTRIRPDEYYGRPLATAAQDYLTRRKGAAPADEILKALQAGGFDFKGLGWKETEWLRSLSMSLAKNTQAFHRLPNGMYGLLAWYPEVKKKGTKAGKTNGAVKEGSETEKTEGEEPTE